MPLTKRIYFTFYNNNKTQSHYMHWHIGTDIPHESSSMLILSLVNQNWIWTIRSSRPLFAVSTPYTVAVCLPTRDTPSNCILWMKSFFAPYPRLLRTAGDNIAQISALKRRIFFAHAWPARILPTTFNFGNVIKANYVTYADLKVCLDGLAST